MTHPRQMTTDAADAYENELGYTLNVNGYDIPTNLYGGEFMSYVEAVEKAKLVVAYMQGVEDESQAGDASIILVNMSMNFGEEDNSVAETYYHVCIIGGKFVVRKV